MTEIKIKEHDLNAVIKDLIDSANEINSVNKHKICQFIVNLVNNGGNRTSAALEAGYGSDTGKDGEIRTIEQRKKVASVEAARLLDNPRIKKIYDKLMNHRLTAEIFTKSFSKEHMIHVLYQIGINTYEKNARQAIMAFKACSELAGHFCLDNESDKEATQERAQEIATASSILATWNQERKDKTIDNSQ